MPLRTFILRIDNPVATGYPVQLFDATDDGVQQNLLAAETFTPADLAVLPLTVPGVSPTVRDAQTPNPAGQPVGPALFNLVVSGNVQTTWNALRTAHLSIDGRRWVGPADHSGGRSGGAADDRVGADRLRAAVSRPRPGEHPRPRAVRTGRRTGRSRRTAEGAGGRWVAGE